MYLKKKSRGALLHILFLYFILMRFFSIDKYGVVYPVSVLRGILKVTTSFSEAVFLAIGRSEAKSLARVGGCGGDGEEPPHWVPRRAFFKMRLLKKQIAFKNNQLKRF